MTMTQTDIYVDMYLCDKSPALMVKELGVTYESYQGSPATDTVIFFNCQIPEGIKMPEWAKVETEQPLFKGAGS